MSCAIKFQGYSFTYPDGTKAFEGVSFDIHLGEKVAVVGPNGAGKTSLFLAALGVLGKTAGRAEIFHKPTDVKKNLREIRTRVGYVFQNPDDQLFFSRLAEDLAFGPLNQGKSREEAKGIVGEVLEAMELAGFEDRVPQHMSSGEKKRAAIAGALAMRPEVLILDEPSANLDPQGRDHLVGLISRLEQTAVVISHDLDFVLDFAERVIVMESGRVVADGPAKDILSDEEFLKSHRLALPYGLRKRE